MVHNATPLVTDEWKAPKSKKDTVKWCKGKVGTPHAAEVVIQRYTGNSSHIATFYICVHCNKSLKVPKDLKGLPTRYEDK